jgi:HEAT repeat protein
MADLMKPQRCVSCRRRRWLGRGWENLEGKLYCPYCLPRAMKLAADTKRVEALCESQVRSGLENLQNLRQKVEAIARGQVAYAPVLQKACQALAAGLRDDLNSNYMDGQLKQIESPDSSWWARARSLDETQQACSNWLVVPYLEFLSTLQVPQDRLAVPAVLAQILGLSRLRRIDYNYFAGVPGFPIDFMIGLAAFDRRTTVDELCQLIANPDEIPWVLHQAIIALGRIGDRGASEALAQVLSREDPWGSLVSSAACALIDLKDERFILPVIRSIDRFSSGNYPDWNSRDYIASALGDVLMPGTQPYEQVCSLWQKKKACGPDASRLVADVLETALYHAGGSAAVSIALERLEMDYASALEAVKVLAKSVTDQRAFSALCRVAGQPRTFHHLDLETQMISEDGTNAEHRQLALEVIARQGSAQAHQVLARAAEDLDPKVSKTAAQLLEDFKKVA